MLHGPGQGEALRRGLTARYDWEVPVGATVDYLQGRDGIDCGRIAIAAEGMGTY